MTNWCILRTTGAKTLALANSLAAAGMEVWTPRMVQRRRMPRSNVTREREMAIAPTFVFVRADHLAELIAVRALPVNPHPAFSLFVYAGRIPLIADADVSGFRAEEERAALKARRETRRALVLGQRVKLTDGAYAGLSGIVERDNGEFALVAFAGGMTMKIATWLLSNDVVNDQSAQLGAAA